MAISLQVSEPGLAKIDQIRKQKGWAAMDPAWLKASDVSEATLKRFRLKRPIQREAFIDICKPLGLDWRQVAEGVDDLSRNASSYYIQIFPFSNSDDYYNLSLSSAVAQIPADHWNAGFFKRTPEKAADFDSDDFDYPDVDLGPQGSGDGTVRLHAKFLQKTPTKALPEDDLAMQAWTRIRLEDGKVYKITTRSNVSTLFRLKQAGTEQWIDQVGGDWRDRGSSALAKTISFSFQVPKSTDYDLYLYCYRLAADSDLNVMLEEEVTPSIHPDSEPEAEATHARASNSASRQTRTQPQIDWGEAPSVLVFHGREKEIDALERRITKNDCRLVTLLGMTGIGKTALAVKLVERLQDKFDYIIWRTLDYDPPPTLERLLESIIKFLSNQLITKLPDNLDSKISLLIEHLRKHKCLLVLDNFESLMQAGFRAGRYQEGYEQYGELLKRVGKERHQSCLVLTSREKPEEVVELEEKGLPVHSFPLEGLREEDAKEILKSKDLSDENQWGNIIEIFQGNPQALQIVSTKIQRVFGGQVSEFLEQNTITVRQVGDLVDEQFNCLSDLEKKIVYWLADKGQPVSFSDFKNSIQMQETGAELLDALESLLRRALIKEEQARFTLDKVVNDYVRKLSTNKSYLDLAPLEKDIKKLLLKMKNDKSSPESSL